MTKAFGNKSDAKKEQIEELIRHKQEALGCKRLKAISAAKGFVLKHTAAVFKHGELPCLRVTCRRPILTFN